MVKFRVVVVVFGCFLFVFLVSDLRRLAVVVVVVCDVMIVVLFVSDSMFVYEIF